jgi:MFS family permease
VGLAVFLAWERRCDSPILHVALFARNRVFAFANAAALINYAASAAVGFLLSIYLQCARGFTPRHAGWILVAQPVVMAMLSPLAGRLSDRLPPRRLASAGMLCTAVGLAALCGLTLETPVGWIVAVLGLHGLGFALFSSPNTHAIMGSVPPRHYGTASGTVSTMRVIGQMLSMAVVMVIVALILGRLPLRAASPESILRCMSLSFAVLAVLCLFGIAASLVGGRGLPSESLSERRSV